jgi:hypothetical protein
MTKKTRYQAITPDGRHTVTRTSAREYTCALAVHHPYVCSGRSSRPGRT